MANIKDVAKLAGVSVTTVSRVLNNKGYISQDTYESVYRAIDQLDYVPNQIARNLFKQKSYYISLIVPDSSHPFWAEITKYIERKLYKHHYKLFLCNTGDTEDKERDYIKMMRENMVDGIILGTHMLAETEYQNLDLPIVALDYRVAEDIPTIYSDHNKGVKCIDYTWDTKQKTEDYYQQMNELFDKYPEMDAMFSEDLIIMNALKCAGERGMHIPDEFKTVGYDGTLIAKMSYPSMTYISQPIKELADTLVDVLLKKINGAKLSEDIVLEDVCLVKGQTTE